MNLIGWYVKRDFIKNLNIERNIFDVEYGFSFLIFEGLHLISTRQPSLLPWNFQTFSGEIDYGSNV